MVWALIVPIIITMLLVLIGLLSLLIYSVATIILFVAYWVPMSYYEKRFKAYDDNGVDYYKIIAEEK